VSRDNDNLLQPRGGDVELKDMSVDLSATKRSTAISGKANGNRAHYGDGMIEEPSYSDNSRAVS